MKHFTLLATLLTSMLAGAQSLPFDFEGDITTEDFVDFDGGTATVIPNPQSSGINTSATVAQIVRDGGEQWGGSKVLLDANLDFSTEGAISMKVFTTAPIGTIVKFKLEGAGQTEIDIPTTVSGEWEEITWDFTGAPADFNWVVFMFDFGNVGNGSENSTFLFDDVTQGPGAELGEQLDLPVTFDDAGVEYSVIDFEGNSSMIVADPLDATNTVVMSTKTDTAAPWAGTTIGTAAGFATDIPFTISDTEMSVRVWSPTANTPVRLKVEDANDVTHTCETETNTTVAGAWEILVFDFSTEAPGTAALSFGLENGWVYNKASIFFNFGTDGATAGETAYYFDDVYFGALIDGVEESELSSINVFPNPTENIWNITNEGSEITGIKIFDLNGRVVFSENTNSSIIRIQAQDFTEGIYMAELTSLKSTRFIKLVKD